MITILQSASPDAFERDLAASVRGEVHFDEGYRAMYSTDAANYRFVPRCVVLPLDADDAQRAMEICARHDVPVTPRGGGTSLTGSSCNVGAIFDYSKHLNAVLELDPQRRTARVQSGVVLDDLRAAAAKYGLTYGPAPATHSRCNIGGMFGNNSCGMPAQFAGRMEENVLAAEVLLYDGTRLEVGATSDAELNEVIAAGERRGEIYAQLREIIGRYGKLVRERYPQIPRRISGYNLNQLLPENGFNVARALVGSEGTIVHALELTLRLVPIPKHTSLAIVGYDDLPTAAEAVPKCNEHLPYALEGMDDAIFQYMHEKGEDRNAERALFGGGHAWLVVQFGAEEADEARAKAQALIDDLRRCGPVRDGRAIFEPSKMQQVFDMRDLALGSTSKIPNEADYYPGWEDAAVPPERLAEYLREFIEKMDAYGYDAAVYGHFGQGCVHCSINFDLFTQAGIAKYRRFVTEMAHIVVKYGGSLSGEHGDGQSRGELLSIMYGDELVDAFKKFKRAFDPRWKMNPGKVVDAYRLDENLRWGPNYEPWQPETKFRFEEDRHSFAYAANRCVGAGVCRKHDKGTMCPSYMVSREERYATRGRARLLFEMMQGDPIREGWRSEAVHESLEFCLACKGCKHECPVNVDMATYKAEFLYHYFKGRARPLSAWLFGYMFVWARLASLAPGVANFFSQAPPFAALLKKLASIAPQRRIPMFASETFRRSFARRRPRNVDGPRVVLWTDTWNEYFHPNTARAAVEVLEDAGFFVLIPPHSICCGRPLYDFGLLDGAKRQLTALLDDLRPFVRRGLPMVVLEPSCLSVFKDEMQNLLGRDIDAERLAKQAFTLTEFLIEKAPDYRAPSLDRVAVLHQHCHKKALLDAGAERRIFDRMALASESLESGCCGMAGAFGFEEKHYEMSTACGERVLLPKVREAAPETIVVADGFSCREQIAQCTDRQALHPAEVIAMAIADKGLARDDARPERRFRPDIARESARIVRTGYAVVGAVALVCAGVAAAFALRRR